MAIVGGFDMHRQQITFDYLNTETGEVSRGEIRPATRVRLANWLRRFRGTPGALALEATTGWRFVVEELQAAGIEAHLAEPADTRALRGPKRRAKNDRQDARHLRELLQAGRVPESWIPPAHIQELRSVVRLRKTLMDDRRAWQQRIQAVLYHHGQPARPHLLTGDRREWLASLELSPAGRQTIDLALRLIDRINEELEPIERQPAAELGAGFRRGGGLLSLGRSPSAALFPFSSWLLQRREPRMSRSSWNFGAVQPMSSVAQGARRPKVA